MNKKIICVLIILFVIIAVIGINGSVFHKQNQTKQNEIHVAVDGNDESGKGTKDAPFATVSVAAKKAPGSIVVVHEGDYGPVKLGPECSGIEKVPLIIRPAKDDKVVIHANSGAGISLTADRRFAWRPPPMYTAGSCP